MFSRVLARWRRRRRPSPPPCPWPAYWATGLVLLLLTNGILLALGRPLLPEGMPRFWDGSLASETNSQHFLDWYSLLHLVYGLIWAGILWLTSRHWPLGWLLVVALVAAAGWEVAENTPFMIARYGTSGADPSYGGDTLLNATGDMLCVVAGCWLGFRLGWKRALALGLAIEVALAFIIHDSLAIGTIMLLHPLEAVRAWRMSAA
ncbi:DUF2585 family protein [Pseudoroseomonas wenyumeiae]|uniref:DUF2585 family protein n=1 Tax=Teichococcus wenyumeiae TaxID=2478470 RepID=A0A3A9JD35_9PROT|nr:DUF2585 family protein [Pseudoroseomonas wenyumeiae]RMI24534.1 DUF2585 family protein [Pseudoroseomonas wenyumeiae]